MTQYTPNLRIPYPEAADPPRGWEQIQAVAEAVDTYAVNDAPSITQCAWTGQQHIAANVNTPISAALVPGSKDFTAGSNISIRATQEGWYWLWQWSSWLNHGPHRGVVNLVDKDTGSAQGLAMQTLDGYDVNTGRPVFLRQGDGLQWTGCRIDANDACATNVVHIMRLSAPPLTGQAYTDYRQALDATAAAIRECQREQVRP